MARYKSKSADVVYDFACNIAYKEKRFYVSVERAARYLGLASNTVRQAYRELTEKGWFRLIEEGNYSPNVYEPVLNHDAWVAANPGQCCVKSSFPWTLENDELGQAIWAITGGKIKPKSHSMKAIRKMIRELGCSAEDVAEDFRKWYPNQNHAPKYVLGHFIKHFRELSKIKVLAIAA
jgi:hypothetical protein